MYGAELTEIKPDYIILDEFHRCGTELRGKGVQNLLRLCPNVPILGLAATNIRYPDNQRDMVNAFFDNEVASKMTLDEVIVRVIVNLPRYVLSCFSYQNSLGSWIYRMSAPAKRRAWFREAEFTPVLACGCPVISAP